MSPPLRYLPAYIGLFLALALGLACNAFLDIQYGSFGREVSIWAAVFAFTLHAGWKQEGKASELGKSRQKWVLWIGGALSVIVFIPMWGFPRAGVYLLCVLQASNNCVTTTRRQLHLGLLVSLVMVMFAGSHYRADWTMLFYLVPYVIAVVFTLVAEQINRHTEDLRRQSVGQPLIGGQGIAIAAATTAILLLSTLLYLLTPQLTRLDLEWRYGQLADIGFVHQSNQGKQGARGGQGKSGGQNERGPDQGQGQAGSGQEQAQGDGGGENESAGLFPASRWPSVDDMRNAAKRSGMPKWQSNAVNQLADMQEMAGARLVPIKQKLKEIWQDINDWLKQHRKLLIATLFGLIVLAVVLALLLLLKELELIAWVRVHMDYLRFGLLAIHGVGSQGVQQYYAAIERFLAQHEVKRSPTANTREYLALSARRFDHLQKEIAEMTILFERARYGSAQMSEAQVHRMRDLYRTIYRAI